MNKQVTTIFFDIGGVLINIHPEKTFKHLSNCTGIHMDVIKNRFPLDIHEEYEKGNLSNKEWFLAVKKSLPQPCSLQESSFWEAWKLLVGKEKNSVKILKKLKGYYSVWLLSNTNPCHIKDEIDKKFEFPHLADGKIYSFDIGLRKPDKAIYKIAASRASSIPERCLFIDDQRENVIAAENTGFIGIHFQSFEQLQKDLYKTGILANINLFI